MEKNKSVVEQTLLQIKAVEDAISENAKGILASTMKQEISELVKESLKGRKNLHEQDENDPEMDEPEIEGEEQSATDIDPEMDGEEEDGVEDLEPTDADMVDVEDGDNQEELPPLDMTQASAEEVLRVFKAMGDQDGIIVKKQDDGDIHLVDNNNNTEYLISFGGESEPIQDNVMENEDKDDFLSSLNDSLYGREMGEDFEYEDEDEFMFDDEMGMGYEDEKFYEMSEEDLVSVMETFKYGKKPNMDGGFDEKMKEGPKRHGKNGNAKNAAKYPSKMKHGVTEVDMEEEEFDSWEEESYEDVMSYEEGVDMETTEASRTLGNGKYWGRKGLPKPRTAPKHLRVESVNKELESLREKNEEYKKALDFFRNKLNEVAVFNSNLAYSTRLFTEHSTTKQEKINILRRFDNVETLKESKNLYKTIKNELDGEGTKNVVKESITEKVIKTPKTGSSTNLIENKTYENPQFLRMKDLMSKIK